MPPRISDEVEYRDVPSFPGYRVGDDGTVWTRYEAKGGSKLGGVGQGGMKLGNKWKLRKARQSGGNKAWRVNLCHEGKVISKFVHQLVLEAFIGPCPPGMVCRHGPEGKHCNNLSNLQWGTQKDNIADKYRDGTRVVGVAHHAAKMTPELVRALRFEHSLGIPVLHLARKYKLARATVRSIVNRITWKEVA